MSSLSEVALLRTAPYNESTMVITLTGENDYLRQTELNRLLSAFAEKHGAMAIERLDGEEVQFQVIYDSLTGLSLLSDNKMVVIHNPSANAEFVNHAESLLNNLSKSIDLVLIEKKLDKRSVFYKLLKKSTELKEITNPDIQALPQWVCAEANQRGGSIQQNDARYLIERIGPNQQRLSTELDKLLLYNPLINRLSIELLTEREPQSTIFELLESAFAGNTKQALKIYHEQRQLKVEPQQIIAMLAWQLHVLAVIRTAGDRSPEQIAADTGINPYVIRKSNATARRLTISGLKKSIKTLSDLDVRLKSTGIDADEALQLFLLKDCPSFA